MLKLISCESKAHLAVKLSPCKLNMFRGELVADSIKYLLPSAATGAALKAVTFHEGIKSALRSGAMHHGSLESCLVFLLCVLFSHALIIHASFQGFQEINLYLLN